MINDRMHQLNKIVEDTLHTILTPTKKLNVEKWKKINPQQVLLCLEQEYTMVTTADLEKYNIKYLGTKNLHTCIFIYIYSKNQHLIMHLNNMKKFDLKGVLSKFENKNLKLIMLGGENCGKNYKEAREILIFLLYDLIVLKEKLGISLKIVGQKLMMYNYALLADYPMIIYDKAMKNANILHLYLYQSPLEKKRVSFLTPRSFEELYKLDRNHELFFVLLNESGPYPYMQKDFLNALEALAELLKDRDFFYNSFIKLISKQGFQWMLKSWKYQLEGAQLRNFAFDFKMKKLYPIPGYTSTPNEYTRLAKILDAQHPDTYFKFFDQSGYCGLQLRPSFSKKCKLFSNKNEIFPRQIINRNHISDPSFSSYPSTYNSAPGLVVLQYLQYITIPKSAKPQKALLENKKNSYSSSEAHTGESGFISPLIKFKLFLWKCPPPKKKLASTASFPSPLSHSGVGGNPF